MEFYQEVEEGTFVRDKFPRYPSLNLDKGEFSYQQRVHCSLSTYHWRKQLLAWTVCIRLQIILCGVWDIISKQALYSNVFYVGATN